MLIHFLISSLAARNGKLTQKLWQPDILNRVKIAVGGHAESIGQVSFAIVGSAKHGCRLSSETACG